MFVWGVAKPVATPSRASTVPSAVAVKQQPKPTPTPAASAKSTPVKSPDYKRPRPSESGGGGGVVRNLAMDLAAAVKTEPTTKSAQAVT